MELSESIKNREILPSEVANLFFDRIGAKDSALNSYITLAEREARVLAEQYDKMISAGDYKGRLHGIPISIKDLILTKNIRTTYGSKLFSEFVPSEDATVVSRLKEAGAVILGKSNLHEFACGVTNDNPHYGTCRNPWDKKRIPGGSSGGSAVAVSASLCSGSLGGDTGGSIRIPASLCGVVGLKPTYGRVSRYGSMTESWSLDHLGPMARTVEDLLLILDAISGYDARDPSTINKQNEHFPALASDIRGKRIAYILEYYQDPNLDVQVRKAFDNACTVFENEGAIIEEVSIPWINSCKAPAVVIAAADAVSNLWDVVKNRLSDLTKDVRIFLEFGKTVSAEDYLKAQKIRTTIIQQMNILHKTFDLIVSPTTPNVAPELDSRHDGLRESLIEFTILFNMTGAPAISLPCGFCDSGLPIGLQISGRPCEDSNVLEAAYLYEQRTKWHERMPPI
jgi:aspartyl-tRNA(Asn)/glutamyl-tRNA(Gln) amidotransferase subunit A